MIEAFIKSGNELVKGVLKTVKFPMEDCKLQTMENPLSIYDQLLSFENFDITKVLITNKEVKVGGVQQRKVLEKTMDLFYQGNLKEAYKYISTFFGTSPLPAYLLRGW